MSEYFVPGHFLQELQRGATHDDTSAFDAFGDVDFDAAFGDEQFLENLGELPLSQEQTPESQANDQVQLPTGADDLFRDQELLSRSHDDILASNTSRSDQAEVDEPSEDCQHQSDPNKAVNNREEVSSDPKNTPITNSPNHDQSSGGERAEEPSEIVEGQGEVSRLHDTILENHPTNNIQYQPSLPDEDHQYDIEWNDFDELVAQDPVSNSQPGDSVTENHESLEFQFDIFASKEWQDYANNAPNGDLADFLGTDAQEEPRMDHQPSVGRHERSQFQTYQQLQPSHFTPQPYMNNKTSIQPTHPQAHEQEEVSDRVILETYDEDDTLITVDHPIQKGWGRTGKRYEEEVWFNPETGKWQPSASHHDMRATLIERAQAEYPNDRYLYPDETGGLPHGETAFFKPHQNRGPNREDCADELFVWREYTPKKDKHGKPLRKGKPRYTRQNYPGFMFEGGRILLDPHNNPVVDHKFIPLTLSIYTAGSKLQEMALRPECRQIDLWARMPRWERKINKNGDEELIPLRDKNTRINMPMTRFREKKGTIAGGDRDGTAEVMAGLTNFYHYNNFDPVASGNSVKAFPRDLETWEIKAVRLGNTAKFGHRAGHRAVDNTKRAQNFDKLLKSIETGREKQEGKKGDVTRKRRSEDEVADNSHTKSDPQKRRRRGQEVDAGFATWDRQNAAPLGAPTFEDGQHVYGGQSSPYSHQQGGSFPASAPPQTHFHGASESPYQQRHPQMQPASMQNRVTFNHDFSGIGSSFLPVQNETHQSPYGPLQMQATRSPYEIASPTVHNRPMSNVIPGYRPYGQFNHDQHGPPVQRQQPIQRPNGALNDVGNSLGPGGRAVHQVLKPKQVLGKRRQQDTGEAESGGDWNNGTQRQQINAQVSRDPELGASSKRQRNNEIPGAEPMPQRRHQPSRTSRPRYYGAGGAPGPLLPSNDGFGTSQPGFGLHSDAKLPLKTPEELFREMGGVFGMNVGQSMGPPGPARPQQMMDGREPQQVLGKRGRGESMGHYTENIYMPQQSLWEQGPTERLDAREEEHNGPAPKRRFMPRTEGYYAPPMQAPKAQLIQKTRKAERDAHLPPPQLYTNHTVPNPYQSPRVEQANPMPPRRNPMYTDEVPHLIHTRVLDPSPAPPPALNSAISNEHLHHVMRRRRRLEPGNEDGSLQETRRGNGPGV